MKLLLSLFLALGPCTLMANDYDDDAPIAQYHRDREKQDIENRIWELERKQKNQEMDDWFEKQQKERDERFEEEMERRKSWRN